MVFTLQRYIFRELFRVFVLAAVALMLMLSIGSILRPIQEYGAGPTQAIHLMGYFLPITLTFILPMAALFAASLVYGRFAADNELDACRASGISLMTLVYPGLALAIMVAIANLILSFYVTPAFVQRAQKSLKADAKQIIFRNIQRHGYYRPPDGRYLIYADQVVSQKDTLLGVIITELNDNRIERTIAAESAVVKFNTHKQFNEVQVTAYNTYQTGDNEVGFSTKWITLTKEFPTLMSDELKFKKIDEIKAIRVDPMLFYPIAKIAYEAYSQFTAELLAQDIDATLSSDPNATYRLYSGTAGKSGIEFKAGKCVMKDRRKIELSNITLAEADPADPKRVLVLNAEKGYLHIEGEELSPTLTIELLSATWQRIDGTKGLTSRHLVRGLVLPKSVTDTFTGKNVLDVLSPEYVGSTLKKGPEVNFIALQNELRRKIQKTLVEIKAEMYSRLVFGLGCVLMILIGIGLGIIQKGGHLLTAFGSSCIPAAVLIVCIMMGKNIARNRSSSSANLGLLLMWVGLILLALLAYGIYRRLMRN